MTSKELELFLLYFSETNTHRNHREIVFFNRSDDNIMNLSLLGTLSLLCTINIKCIILNMK